MHACTLGICGCRPTGLPRALARLPQARLDAAAAAATAAFHVCPNLQLLADAMLAHPVEQWEERCPLTPGGQGGTRARLCGVGSEGGGGRAPSAPWAIPSLPICVPCTCRGAHQTHASQDLRGAARRCAPARRHTLPGCAHRGSAAGALPCCGWPTALPGHPRILRPPTVPPAALHPLPCTRCPALLQRNRSTMASGLKSTCGRAARSAPSCPLALSARLPVPLFSPSPSSRPRTASLPQTLASAAAAPQVLIFSRNCEDCTARFPDVARQVRQGCARVHASRLVCTTSAQRGPDLMPPFPRCSTRRRGRAAPPLPSSTPRWCLWTATPATGGWGACARRRVAECMCERARLSFSPSSSLKPAHPLAPCSPVHAGSSLFRSWQRAAGQGWSSAPSQVRGPGV